jgi:hypothetical protein
VEIPGNTRSTNITNPGNTWKGVNTMKYFVTIPPIKAFERGRNSGTYEGTIDASRLTVEQRKFLVEKTKGVRDGIDGIVIDNEKLLDSSGNFTPESIQTAMNKTQEDIDKTFNRYVKEAEEKIHKYEKNPECYPGTLFSDYYCPDKILSEEQITIKNNLVSKAKALEEKYAAEKQAKIDKFTTHILPRIFHFIEEYENGEDIKRSEQKKEAAEKQTKLDKFTTYILPLIEEYENGGERPKWDGKFIGSHSLLARICKEDQKRSEQKKVAAEERKYNQLTEIINKYGSDLQKRKWEQGMMERKEAIHLLWINTFTKGVPIPTNVWKSESYFDYRGVDLKHKEDKIEKISDDEFKTYEEIISMYPDFSAQLMREIGYYYDDEEYTFECHFVRLTKKIGEYEMEADFIIVLTPFQLISF